MRKIKHITFALCPQLLSVALIMLCAVSELYPAGTPAGTLIQNRTRATYSTASGGTVDTVYSSYVTIRVSQIGAFNISPISGSLVTVSDSVNADFALTVTNSGNGSDIGRLSVLSSKGFTVQLYADANGDGVLQANELSAGTITQTSPLAADARFKLIARVKVPRDESLNGTKDSTTLVVTSNFDAIKTISGLYSTTIQTANLTGITSGLSVSNSAPTANSNITYTLAFTNNGSVTATGMMIYDFIGTGFTFVSGTTSQGTFNGGTNPLAWNIGSVSPGATVTITLTLLVNGNNPSGTNLTDSMTVAYAVGGNSYTVGTNAPTIIVGGGFGVQITPYMTAMAKQPGDTAVYRFNVRNIGSIKDLVELQTSSTRNWDWKFYRDANNNQAWDGTDPLLTDTNALSGIDVDSVAAGDSVRIFAVTTTIPRTKTNSVKDTLQINAISSGDNTKQSVARVVTSVNEPVITVTLSPIPNQPAGAVVTYLISYSNTGGASVNNFSIVGSSPGATEYVPNSVHLNGVSIQDNTGSLSIADDTNGNKIITVNIGILSAQTSGSMEFKVKIK